MPLYANNSLLSKLVSSPPSYAGRGSKLTGSPLVFAGPAEQARLKHVQIRDILDISIFELEEEYSSPGEGKHSYLPLLHKLAVGKVGDKVGHTSNPKIPLDSLSDEDFFEWFRGFVDAEGSFFIQILDNRFKFIFALCLHKDETSLIKYITQRLGVGNISIRDKSVNYTLSSKGDLLNIFSIFDIRPLNTSKNLNYILFRQAYDLYFNRESLKVTMEQRKVIINLKDQMNKKRIDFNQPKGHSIDITHY